MKTIRSIKTVSAALFIILFFFTSVAAAENPTNLLPDTTRFIAVRGTVLDSQTHQPVVFASVFIKGTNIGTVANSDGNFLIKIPLRYEKNKLGFTSIGYKSKYIPVSDFNNDINLVYLDPAIIPIKEVVIRHLEPIHLLTTAMERVTQNYSVKPVNMTGFYRETIKKNRKYLSVAEAVLKIYKSPYGEGVLSNDRVTIFKGRKAQYVKKRDTLIVKFQGGPLSLSYLDVVKNPGDILSPDMFPYYNYHIDGVIKLDKRETYVISFDQKDTVTLPLFKGKIYLDAQNLAVAGIEVEVSPKQLQKAINYVIRKKPAGLKVHILGIHILVKYRKIGNKWYLNYLRNETDLRFKWPKKLFHSNYTIIAETAITNISTKNVVKPKFSQRFKPNEIFSEKVSDFSDPNFWGANNVIEPEISIQSAIKKLSRKLRRKQQ